MNYRSRPESLMKHQNSHHKGFALVVTLTLMVLLTIIALGILSLGTVSLRTASAGQADATARANARMAVLIAIGELQKYAGPDKRITTNGTFDPASPGSYGKAPADVQNPWLAGIWKRREDKPLDPNETAYDPHPVDAGQTAWIVSGNENITGAKTTPTTLIPNPDTAPSESVWMLRKFLQESNLDPAQADLLSVKVPLVKVVNGSYGYWVSDESQKAAVDLNHHDKTDYAGHSQQPSDIELARLGRASDTSSLNLMQGLETLPINQDAAWKKAFTLAGMEVMPGVTPALVRKGIAQNYHSIAKISDGVQSDSKLGGLKRDLTIAFESEDAEFNKNSFFTREGQQKGTNSDDSGANLAAFSFVNSTGSLTEPFSHEMMFYKDSDNAPLSFKAPSGSGGTFIRLPTWHALRDYYRTYKKVSSVDTTPSLVGSATGMTLPNASNTVSGAYSYISRGADSMDADTFNTRSKYPTGTRGGNILINPTQIGFNPVVARLQIGYSFVSGSGTDSNATKPRTSLIKLVADPVVTLWNPYNTTLNVTGYSLSTWLPDMMVVIEKQELYVAGRTYSPGDQCVVETTEMVYEAKTTTTSNPQTDPAEWEQKPSQNGWILAANSRVENISANYGGTNMTINLAKGGSFTMEPGELVVFSPNTSTPQDYSGSGGWTFDMERGWNEKGGIAFDRLRADNTNRTLRGSGNPATSYWDSTPFMNDPRGKVWVDGEAKVRMTIEPYRSYGNSYVIDDPFRFVARYPEGGFRIASGKGGFPPNSTRLGEADSLTGDNEGMPYSELMKIPGTSSSANIRSGFGITANYRAKGFIGVYDGPFGKEAPTPGMSDEFTVGSELSPTNKRWLGSFDWYLRNEADVDSYPVVIGKYNPRFHYNTHGISSNLHPYGRVTTMPFQLLFRRETSPKNMTNIDGSSRGFWGASNAASGESHVPMFEIPTSPLVSLAQFQHFHASPLEQDPAYIIANSDTSAVIARDKASEFRNITNVDRSWYLNEVLFDSFFLSTLRPLDIDSVIDDSKPLRNPRFRFTEGGESKVTVKTRLKETTGKAHAKVAANLIMKGAFNVNSTSTEAWKAFLAGAYGNKIAFAPPGSSVSLQTTTGVPITRTTTPNGGVNDLWRGYSELDDTELTRLSDEIVKQVRLRGPFLSISDFVNRRLKNDATGDGGALQIAIRDAGLNDRFSAAIDTSTFTRIKSETGSTTNYPFPEQAVGPIAQGAAPGFIQQGDILQIIAPALTVHGDTFLVRGYGESKDSSGKVLARAWCEATVQRTPNYVQHTTDASNTTGDVPWADPATLKPMNVALGRRFKVISFRWLKNYEI